MAFEKVCYHSILIIQVSESVRCDRRLEWLPRQRAYGPKRLSEQLRVDFFECGFRTNQLVSLGNCAPVVTLKTRSTPERDRY